MIRFQMQGTVKCRRGIGVSCGCWELAQSRFRLWRRYPAHYMTSEGIRRKKEEVHALLSSMLLCAPWSSPSFPSLSFRRATAHMSDGVLIITSIWPRLTVRKCSSGSTAPVLIEPSLVTARKQQVTQCLFWKGRHQRGRKATSRDRSFHHKQRHADWNQPIDQCPKQWQSYLVPCDLFACFILSCMSFITYARLADHALQHTKYCQQACYSRKTWSYKTWVSNQL